MTPLERLIAKASTMHDTEKIALVHRFFEDNIEWRPDLCEYSVAEYWATPAEVMERKAGDCEDIAIAKYFTLKEAGMTDDQLKIVYGQICKEDTWVPHMVLMCHSWDGQIILDNVNNKIMPENSRWDFISILAFNLSGIWIFKNGHPKLITTNCKRLKKWRELIERYEMSKMCMRNFRYEGNGA